MLGIDKLVKIVDTVYSSQYLEDHNPLSLLLISGVGTGKSQILLERMPPEGIVLNDVTSRGIWDTLMLKPDKSKSVIFVIPDFNTVISHPKVTVQATISAFLGLLAEGTFNMRDAGGEKNLAREYGHPVKASLATAMSDGVFFGMKEYDPINKRMVQVGGLKRKMQVLGFLRRLLPIRYDYSIATSLMISKSIREGKYKRELTFLPQADRKARRVRIPARIAGFVEDKSRDIARLTDIERHGFSVQKTFRTYVSTRALMRGKSVVSNKDVDDLNEMASFIELRSEKVPTL